jgi:glycerol-3-phosphate acyltransferase PlsY
LLAFALALALTRYVSVASIVGALSLAVAVLISPGTPALRMSAVALGVFIVFKHRANLRRLAAGTESRLGSRRA